MSKIYRLLIIGICIAILIVACDRSASSPPRDRPISNSESCRLVKHEMGATEICGQPKKVAALSPFVLSLFCHFPRIKLE